MIDLKAWRTGHGMTQQQAADALGIGNSTVRAIEAGTREMTATLSLACHGWDATQPRTSCDEPVAEQLVPASVEARMNAIEQQMLPEAVRAAVLQWHATWLARQPLPAATINKALKAWQADDDMTEEEHEAAKARARAAFASEDKAPYQSPSEDEIQRQIRQTMRDRQEAQAREKAEKRQAEELAMTARRAARSVLPE